MQNIHVLLQEQWGGQGTVWSGQPDPDPHVHGDTNIHYSLLLYERMHHVLIEMATGT